MQDLNKGKKKSNKKIKEHQKQTNESTDEQERYYVCMVKQIQGSSKSEAKICITQKPMYMFYKMNRNCKNGQDLINFPDYSETTSCVVSSKRSTEAKKSSTKDKRDSQDGQGQDAEEITPDILGDKGSLFWNIEMIIGKFNTKEAAKTYAGEWDKKSRGIKSRRNRGLEVLGEWNKKGGDLICYDKTVIPCNLNSWLVDIGLEEYQLQEDYMRKLEHTIQRTLLNNDANNSQESFTLKTQKAY